jgi:GNAT superfamily N-acetyltransferase
MVSVTSRPWRGYEDLPALQSLALEAHRLEGRRATWHVGDVAWGLRQHAGREHEWQIRLWEDGDRVVAWSWLRMNRATLDHLVHPEYSALLDDVLDEPDAREAFALEDDRETVVALARHGFTRRGEAMDLNARDVGEPPAVPALPDGFRLRSVEPGDLAERVAVHRDVWAPSRVTEESYANVMRAWPYRPSLDCVVEAPDGRFAAYCLLWPDDENGVGELEPVGTRQEFRGRGFGAAVCVFALRRWYDEGGRQAIVYCVTDPARALYRSLGFECHTAVVGFAR